MRTTDILLSAWANMRRNKTRSVLTIVAVFVGATTIMLTNGIGDGIKGYLNRQVASLGVDGVLITSIKSNEQTADGPQKYDPTKTKASAGVGPENARGGGLSPFLLSSSDIDKIRSIKGVVSVEPATSLTVEYISAGSEKYQVDAQTIGSDFLTFDVSAGAQLQPDTYDYEVLLPSSYVSVLGYANASDALGKTVRIQVNNQLQEGKEFQAKIVGVVNKSLIASNAVIVNKQLAKDAVAYQNIGKSEAQKNLFSAAITHYNASWSDEQVTELKDRLSQAGYSAKTIEDQQQTVFAVIDAVVVVLNMFGIVALAAASFGIINTLYMAVQERTKEIGLMKAVGMSRGKIFSLFSIEAALLGLIGSGAGVLVANVVGRLVNNIASQSILKDFEGLQLLSFKLVSVLTIVCIVTFIAFLAGTLPARKASKLDAIEALRYE